MSDVHPKLSPERLPNLPSLASRLEWSGNVDARKRDVIQKLGISDKTWSRYVRGDTVPDANQVVEIAKIVGVPLDWLLLGTETARPDRDADENGDSILVPLLSVMAAAGAGAHNGDAEIIDYLPFSRAELKRLGVSPDHVQFIRGLGDSMEPTLRDGALILVDRSKREVRGDAIYVVSLGDEVRIKRIRKAIDGSYMLISDNSERYPPEVVAQHDAERLKVHGRVFWTERLL